MVPSPASKRKSSRRLPSYLRKSAEEPVGELRRLRDEARNAARERDGLNRGPSSSSRGPAKTAAEVTGTPLAAAIKPEEEDRPVVPAPSTTGKRRRSRGESDTTGRTKAEIDEGTERRARKSRRRAWNKPHAPEPDVQEQPSGCRDTVEVEVEVEPEVPHSGATSSGVFRSADSAPEHITLPPKREGHLSKILRHEAHVYDLPMDSAGFIPVIEQHLWNHQVTPDEIKQAVRVNRKSRFQIKTVDGVDQVRAVQGHGRQLVQYYGLSDSEMLQTLTARNDFTGDSGTRALHHWRGGRSDIQFYRAPNDVLLSPGQDGQSSLQLTSTFLRLERSEKHFKL
ncbi:TPT1 [Symbiodinium sp. KB8]|nr:TPT1 [Symbiodinium sp. KB8]